MENAILFDKLKNICETKLNENMSDHTSFRTGGPCDIMLLPKSEEELTKALSALREASYIYTVIGNGSNLLVSDKGIDGAVIKLGKMLDYIEVAEDSIKCGAGTLLSKAANAALEHSLAGFEFAAGIPGSIGGAVYMNAGAYGGEMKDVVKSVSYIDNDGEIKTVSGDKLDFSYRHSFFCDNPDLIITSVVIKLSKGNKENIKAAMYELSEKRKSKQPLEYPSAGSTFKRPEGYFAAKLIEDSGLKGYTSGGAAVSEKHAGFVINKGNATTQDVLDVMEHVKETVKEKFGVMLENEVRVIGR